jgi:hypothetical protein
MSIVSSAASGVTSAERNGVRARVLVNGLWDVVLPLRLSCVALRDYFSDEEMVIEDARSG